MHVYIYVSYGDLGRLDVVQGGGGGIISLDMAPFQITSNYEIKGAKSHPKKTGFGLEASDHMGMIMVTSNGSGVESQGTRTSPFPRVTEDEALQLSCK